MPINPQEALVESTFHNRAAIVITDILDQVGFSQDKLKIVSQVAETVHNMPPFVFGLIGIQFEKVNEFLKQIEPLMLMAQEHDDPAYYLKAIPEEKILFFINQVITRLEWVKNGNESGHKSE